VLLRILLRAVKLPAGMWADEGLECQKKQPAPVGPSGWEIKLGAGCEAVAPEGAGKLMVDVELVVSTEGSTRSCGLRVARPGRSASNTPG
jgi:hypothetical protein